GELILRERGHAREVPQLGDNAGGVALVAAAGQDVGRLLLGKPQKRPRRVDRGQDIRSGQTAQALDQADYPNALADDLRHVTNPLDAQPADVRFIDDDGARLGETGAELG